VYKRDREREREQRNKCSIFEICSMNIYNESIKKERKNLKQTSIALMLKDVFIILSRFLF